MPARFLRFSLLATAFVGMCAFLISGYQPPRAQARVICPITPQVQPTQYQNHSSLYIKAQGSLRNGRHVEAAEFLRQAIQLMGTSKEEMSGKYGGGPYVPYYWLAVALQKLGEIEPSLACLEASEAQGIVQTLTTEPYTQHATLKSDLEIEVRTASYINLAQRAGQLTLEHGDSPPLQQQIVALADALRTGQGDPGGIQSQIRTQFTKLVTNELEVRRQRIASFQERPWYDPDDFAIRQSDCSRTAEEKDLSDLESRFKTCASHYASSLTTAVRQECRAATVLEGTIAGKRKAAEAWSIVLQDNAGSVDLSGCDATATWAFWRTVRGEVVAREGRSSALDGRIATASAQVRSALEAAVARLPTLPDRCKANLNSALSNYRPIPELRITINTRLAGELVPADRSLAAVAQQLSDFEAEVKAAALALAGSRSNYPGDQRYGRIDSGPFGELMQSANTFNLSRLSTLCTEASQVQVAINNYWSERLPELETQRAALLANLQRVPQAYDCDSALDKISQVRARPQSGREQQWKEKMLDAKKSAAECLRDGSAQQESDWQSVIADCSAAIEFIDRLQAIDIDSLPDIERARVQAAVDGQATARSQCGELKRILELTPAQLPDELSQRPVDIDRINEASIIQLLWLAMRDREVVQIGNEMKALGDSVEGLQVIEAAAVLSSVFELHFAGRIDDAIYKLREQSRVEEWQPESQGFYALSLAYFLFEQSRNLPPTAAPDVKVMLENEALQLARTAKRFETNPSPEIFSDSFIEFFSTSVSG